MELDVCIISTVRPEILKLTLDSFRKRFFNLLRKGFPGIKIRGIINIDPAGEPGITPQEMIKNLNLSSYFDIYVLNFPQSPSFPKAVSWCWDQVRTPIFLHLEDDWFLKKTIDFKSDVLDSFDQADNQNKSLVGILCNPSGNKKYPLSSLCLRPSFFRLELIKEIFRSSDNPDILSMSISQDPEKNFKTVA